MKSHSLPAFLLVAALALSGCASDDEPSATPSETATPSSSAPSSPTATPTGKDSEVVADLLRPPGPYGGDDFDLDAAVAEVQEQDPADADEWADAIVDATHGDHAESTQALLDFDPTIGEDPAQPTATPERVGAVEVVGQNHFAVVLDASGSMAERAGGGTRMAAAKQAIRSFASRLPTSSTLSLRVYGHKGSNAGADKAESCAATEVIYEGAPKGVDKALSKFAPTGWTPLAKSIDAARADIPEDASDAIVYVVTDGIETCGGDPVKAARKLAATGAEPVVNVIGFQVGNADQAKLRRIAKAGGGEYADVRSGADLQRYWEADRVRMLQAWTEWKRKALDHINEEGRENLDEVNAHGRSLLDSIKEEWSQQSDTIDALAGEDAFDTATRSQVFSKLYARQQQLWSWAYAAKNTNWSAAYKEKTTRWTEAYALGTGKWSEVYRQRSRPRPVED